MDKVITKDLYLAACFICYGHSLEDVDKSDPRHMKFVFTGEGLKSLETKWISRDLSVPAADFADAIRKMKSLIHSED